MISAAPRPRTLPTGVELSLRPARLDDIGYCYRIYAVGMRGYVEAVYGWDEDSRRRIFAEVFRPGEACIIHGRLGPAAGDVGWLQVEEQAGRFFVKELHVIARARGHGVGSWAMVQVLERASAAGKGVRLATFEISPAVRFYRRLGFEVESAAAGVVWLVHPAQEDPPP